MRNIAAHIALIGACGCGIYTFSGSTLPSHIKTVAIPLFVNQTMEPGLSEELTQRIRDAYISNNALKLTEKRAHSTLQVTLRSYRHAPFTYDEQGNVREYRVTIAASGIFRDERKNKDLWKEDNIVCYGTYSVESRNRESERVGKQRAMQDLSRILIENTISGW